MITTQSIRVAGRFLTHVVGVLLLCWRRALQAAAVSGVIALLLAEIAGILITGQFPTSLTHIVALIFGVTVAYCVALTVLFDEIIRGLIDTVRLVDGEVAAGARAAAIVGEREVGQMRFSLLGALGLAGALRTDRSNRTQATRRGAVVAPAAARPLPRERAEEAEDASGETLADLAHEPALPPLPRKTGSPVRADQLPRIPWVYDDPAETQPSAQRPTALASPAPGSAEPAYAESASTEPPLAPLIMPVTQESRPFMVAPPLSEAPQTAEREPSGPAPRPLDAAATTQPLAAEQPHHFPPRTGLWGRVSSALVGRLPDLPATQPDDSLDPTAGASQNE